MFDIDRWREIFQSISKNKLRSIMSGFTVAFAIILFTLLFGVVNGLSNSFMSNFQDDAMNTMFVRVWKTSKPYKGYQAGRQIQLKNEHVDFILDKYGYETDQISPRIYNNFVVSYKGKSDSYQITGVSPDHKDLEKTIMIQGRYISKIDIDNKEKSIVIGKLMKEDLMGKKNIDIIGSYLNVGGIAYQVVGIFTDEGDDRESRKAYIPYTTAQMVYGNNDFMDQINIGYNEDLGIDGAITYGNELERELKKVLDIHPEDNALFVRNMAEANRNISTFTGALYVIVLFIGLGTLFAGIIGISNIMIFVVKERTKELGIRKALGASPNSIRMMVIQESVFITSFAGYLGLLIGAWILESIGDQLETYFIKDPSVETSVVVGATFVLVVAGTIAGYLPASRAARIKPIVALRAD